MITVTVLHILVSLLSAWIITYPKKVRENGL